MQTFLPYESFVESAQCLDYRRLGKQRVETKQIFFALTKESYGWKTHPAVKMWKGYEASLIDYGRVICQDWIDRGYKDTLLPFFKEHYSSNIIYPPWLGDQSFHISHQSNLVRKFPQHYEKFFPNVKPDIDYVWPV